MPVSVTIPSPLQPYTGNQDTVTVEASTVGEALTRLAAQYEGLRKHLFTEAGKLRTFVNVYVNDEDVRFLQRDQTPLRDSDVLSIIPSIAGGSETLVDCRRR
jgi:molybdopterin converting factor small subunit